jgi:hypothetical protein
VIELKVLRGLAIDTLAAQVVDEVGAVAMILLAFLFGGEWH